jgi:sugar phosphate isomerase/epimerase
MFRTGLCSITHRQLGIEEVIDLAVACGLEGIEWGGDVHVPHGEIELAESVLDATLAAGLLCPSYGSYYRVGKSEEDGLRFETVLDTAEALGVPLIRIWAGDRNSQDATPEYLEGMAAETQRIADIALTRDISLAFEFHAGTLTNTPASCRSLLESVDRASVGCYWQPIAGVSTADNLAGQQRILPWLSHLHVFHWRKTDAPDGGPVIDRRPLAEGVAPWADYLSDLKDTEREHWLYLEFTMGDDPHQTIRDAETLRPLTEGV